MTCVFSTMNSGSPVCCFRSNRILSVQPKHTTRCHRFHYRKNTLPFFSCFPLDPAPLNESCPLQASHFYHCFVLCLKDQTHSTNSRKSFLEIDVKGGERDHIKAYHLERDHIRERVYHLLKGERDPQREREIYRGREYLSRKYFSRIPDAWCSRGEMPHVFLRRKTCSYVLVCISSLHLYLLALVFCSLSSPSILC